MNTQMERRRDHGTAYGEDIHDQDVGLQQSAGHDESEQHGEKKSVLKKVKAKARKIKDTITGHGHGHGHDNDEDDSDEHADEMETDPPVVHGAHTAHGINTGREGTTMQHGTDMGGRTANPVSNPGAYQVFDTTTTHYVPGQEETLGWSRTDTGRQLGSENQPRAIKATYVAVHSTGSLSTGDLEIARKPELGGILEKDPHGLTNVGEDVHPANYQAKVADPTGLGGYGSAAAESFLPGQGGTRQHGGVLGDTAVLEGASYVPVSKPVEYQTFDTPSKYIPEANLGWSGTDTGRSKLSEEKPYAPKNTPVVAHSGALHGTGGHKTGEMGDSERLIEVLEKPVALEKDPHCPRDVGEKRHAENYQSKVTDPTGRGGEEIGVTPILQQLGKMNISDESSGRDDRNVNTGQKEHLFKPSLDGHQKLSTGSHDQFSPESVTHETSTFLQTPEPKPQLGTTELSGGGLHDEPEHKQGSYTEKISSAASALADKAKQATSSVTSKLGYGGRSERPMTPSPGSLDSQSVPHSLDEQPVKGPLDEEPLPVGYGDTLSSVSTAMADTAAHAKDVIASKLGYGGTYAGQPEHIEEVSKTSSVGEYGKKMATTVKETVAPVYDKVTAIGSTVVSKIHGSGTVSQSQTAPVLGTERDVGHAVAPDKGVSMKQYLAEKLMPGEEDKALSQVITEALPLHKQKENVHTTGHGDTGKVEVEKRVTESEQGRKIEIKGRVTESEEVASRLGRAEETDYDGAGPGLASPGKSVVDRIYDAAGSWFNKSGEPSDQTAEVTERAQGSIAKEYEQTRDTGESRIH